LILLCSPLLTGPRPVLAAHGVVPFWPTFGLHPPSFFHSPPRGYRHVIFLRLWAAPLVFLTPDTSPPCGELPSVCFTVGQAAPFVLRSNGFVLRTFVKIFLPTPRRPPLRSAAYFPQEQSSGVPPAPTVDLVFFPTPLFAPFFNALPGFVAALPAFSPRFLGIFLHERSPRFPAFLGCLHAQNLVHLKSCCVWLTPASLCVPRVPSFFLRHSPVSCF